MRALTLHLNWRLTLFTLFFLPLLLTLGFWQLNRAEQKTTLLENWSQQQADEGTLESVKNISTENEGSRISVTGAYDTKRYWLKEGQVVDGKVGLSVLGLVLTTNNDHIVVNMGWIPANPDRRFLPRVSLPKPLQIIEGRLRTPAQSPLTNERDNPLLAWPHRVLEVDFKVMGEQCECRLTPLLIDLNRDDPNAFRVVDRKLNVTPEKHRGYALQWFMMAATLVILWVLTNTNLLELIRIKK